MEIIADTNKMKLMTEILVVSRRRVFGRKIILSRLLFLSCLGIGLLSFEACPSDLDREQKTDSREDVSSLEKYVVSHNYEIPGWEAKETHFVSLKDEEGREHDIYVYLR